MVAAVESYHKVTVGLLVSVPLLRNKGKMRVTATATKIDQQPVGVRPSVCRSLLIGSSDPSQDTATIFRLVHELDRDCNQMWLQAELFT